MATVRYSVITPGVVALAAAAAKTVLNLIAPASFGLKLVEYSVMFDGVTATAAPVLVEVCQSTQAGAGTPAASPPTPVQYMGRTIAHGITTGHGYTAEPTVLTPIDQNLIDPYKGLLIFPVPEDESFECDTSAGAVKALCIRANAPAIVNVRAEMRFERL